MRGIVGSLNAAVAGSVLLFEAVAQRDPAGTGERPPAAEPNTGVEADGPAVEPATEPAASSQDPDATTPEPDATAPEPVDDGSPDLLPGGPEPA